MDVLQVLLDSGRGIRFRVLGPSETDKILINAAKIVGTEGTVIELKKLEWTLGAKMMLVEVTTSRGLKELPTDKGGWKKVDLMGLDSDYDKLFSAKDNATLQALYRQYHEVNESEVQAIISKALPVALEA